MKKVLIFTNVVFLAIILFMACNHHEDTKSTDTRDKCRDLHCRDYSSGTSTGLIDINTAIELAERYKADAGKFYIGNGAINTTEQDARSVWFDLETLKAFIWRIEDTLCKAGCIDSLKPGIRIYYGKYPDSTRMSTMSDLADVKPEYQFHHTVFMVPTYKVGRGAEAKHIDFDPWNMGPDKCKPVSLYEMYKDYIESYRNQKGEPKRGDQKRMLLFAGVGAKTDASGEEQNHGGLAPPPDGVGFPSEY
jgi:hypothetical protein